MKSNDLLVTINGNDNDKFYSIVYFDNVEKIIAYRLNKLNGRPRKWTNIAKNYL
jgi:hypothetical protein